MNLNMEIMYVPQSTILQKKDMMSDWEKTSKNASICSYISAFLSVIDAFISKGVYQWVLLGIALGFIICGVLCKKWKLLGYVLSFFAVTGFSATAVAPFSSLNLSGKIFVITASFFGFLWLYFPVRCIFNYNHVFKELKKSKGFPNFIMNTADLYGDKMYYRDEEKTQYEKSTGVSHNPFNTPEDIREEKFFRTQNIKIKGEEKTIHKDFTNVNGTSEKLKPKEEKRKKYGKKVLGCELTFEHTDIATASFEEKKMLMFKWNSIIENIDSHIVFFGFLMMVAILFNVITNPKALLAYFFLIGLIMGTNYMKLGKLFGAFLTMASIICCWSVPFIFGENFASTAFVVFAGIYSIFIVIPVIRFVMNHHIYRELSTQEGFPSFVRTSADLYGDKLYIVEKREKIKREKLSPDGVLRMDIGYDEVKKKEDKAWNAFDYMDDERKEEEKNEGNSQ